MEGSLKNLVKEVYKNSDEDGNFKFTGNSRNKSNTSQSIKITNTKNSNNNNVDPLNSKSFTKRTKSNKEFNSSSSSSISISTIILIILFILLTGLCAVIYNYYEDIIAYLKNYFHDDTKEKELESKLNGANSSTKKLQDEIGTLKKELENNKKEETTKNKKGTKQYSNLSKQQKKLYSQDQFVKDHGFCYIGEDNNNRHCVEVYNGDICESGDVYKRIDKCLLPNKFA